MIDREDVQLVVVALVALAFGFAFQREPVSEYVTGGRDELPPQTGLPVTGISRAVESYSSGGVMVDSWFYGPRSGSYREGIASWCMGISGEDSVSWSNATCTDNNSAFAIWDTELDATSVTTISCTFAAEACSQ